jgi:lysozyme
MPMFKRTWGMMVAVLALPSLLFPLPAMYSKAMKAINEEIITMGADLAKVADLLIKHEGMILHAYQDSLGYWTIGIGRLIDKRKGGKISEPEARYLLNNDIANVIADLNRALPWWDDLSDNRQVVLIDMCFNLGITNLLGFKNYLSALKDGRWYDAKTEMLNSTWAKQVGQRARDLADMVVNG